MPSLLVSSMGVFALVSAKSLHIRATPSIYDSSDKYGYMGCYNETTQVEGSSRTRALADGITESRKGEMTVPMCLSFCGDGDDEYRYAGLEWSRECWCSQTLSGIAEKLDDRNCTYPCEGNSSQVCGGSLKLSVYRLESAASGLSASLLVPLTGFLSLWFI